MRSYGRSHKTAQLRKCRDHIFAYAVGKIFLFRLAAQIGEGRTAIAARSSACSAKLCAGATGFAASTVIRRFGMLETVKYCTVICITTLALLAITDKQGISEATLRVAAKDYPKLSLETAQRTLRFWQVHDKLER